MGRQGKKPLVLKVVNFMSVVLYLCWKNPRHHLKRTMCGPPHLLSCYVGKFLAPTGIQTPNCPACSTNTISPTLHMVQYFYNTLVKP